MPAPALERQGLMDAERKQIGFWAGGFVEDPNRPGELLPPALELLRASREEADKRKREGREKTEKMEFLGWRR